ncbi:MAG: hypothetical protein J6A79_04010 [Clostridia bacterium]|nr:hypothetical protein [Clostridia bacterium]
MGNVQNLPDSLMQQESFTRKEFETAFSDQYGMTAPQIAYALKKMLDNGLIVRKGWGQYSLPKKRHYQHQYSESATAIAEKIMEDYADLNFQIFELIQLNDFMNHQMAHNTIFVTIENELVDFVFESLWKEHPGRVLLRPNADQYYRYLQDDEIVVSRLPSEAPKGIDEPWMSRLEKILVDVFTDKLISVIVPDGEKPAIINGAFEEYMVDEGTMIRYARRKGADQKMKHVLQEYGKVGEA